MGELQRLRGEIIKLKGNIYDLTAALDSLVEKFGKHENNLEKLNSFLGSPIIYQTKLKTRDRFSEFYPIRPMAI